MSAWQSPRSLAINALAGGRAPSLTRQAAAQAIDEAFRQLTEPDAAMLDSGLRALDEWAERIANGTTPSAGVRKQVIEAVWRAMLDRARQ